MTPCIEEAHRLLRLAERDLQTFHILAAHPEASLSAMCFHAQQSAEKSLKAVLTAHCADFPRTHNLEELAELVSEQQISLPIPARELRRLNPYAVDTVGYRPSAYDSRLARVAMGLPESSEQTLSMASDT